MNPCACIKKDFNLYVGSQDCRTMELEDQSVWMDSSGFSAPTEYELDIKSVENGIDTTLTIDANKRNLLTTKELRGTTENFCINDGFFCFSALSCGVKYTINRAFLCNTRCRIDTYVSKITLNRSNLNDIEELNLLYDSVEINTKLGRLETAKDTFKILQKKLEKLGCAQCSC